MEIKEVNIAQIVSAKIVLPKCDCSACCGDCRYMSRSDSNDDGEYRCTFYDKYYEAGSSACGHFDRR